MAGGICKSRISPGRSARPRGQIKVTDFGVSQGLESTKGDAGSFVGTVTYGAVVRGKGRWGKGVVRPGGDRFDYLPRRI